MAASAGGEVAAIYPQPFSDEIVGSGHRGCVRDHLGQRARTVAGANVALTQ
ncbi:MAG: hypothetical protein IRZ28_20690 [Steroidobacteraceae bacterium]|nr:hypothetical protein [Steroidobacteraceae bacterium]